MADITAGIAGPPLIAGLLIIPNARVATAASWRGGPHRIQPFEFVPFEFGRSVAASSSARQHVRTIHLPPPAADCKEAWKALSQTDDAPAVPQENALMPQ